MNRCFFISVIFLFQSSSIVLAQSTTVTATRSSISPKVQSALQTGITCIGPEMINLICKFRISDYKYDNQFKTADFKLTVESVKYDVGNEFMYYYRESENTSPLQKSVPTSGLQLNGIDFNRRFLLQYSINGSGKGSQAINLSEGATISINRVSAPENSGLNQSALQINLSPATGMGVEWVNLASYCSQLKTTIGDDENGKLKSGQANNTKEKQNQDNNAGTQSSQPRFLSETKRDNNPDNDMLYSQNINEMENAMANQDYRAAKNALEKVHKIKPVDNFKALSQSIDIMDNYATTGSTLSVTEHERIAALGETVTKSIDILSEFFSGSTVIRRWEVDNRKRVAATERKQELHIQKEIAKRKKSLGVDTDIEAMNFTQEDIYGNPVSLASYKGKYLLIIFWASWGTPSVNENNFIVGLYNQYKDRNFDVLGISLDNSRDSWVQAVNKAKLPWKQVSDLKLWDNQAAKMFRVKSIPYICLIDTEGNIIAKNIRDTEIANKLKELLD